MGKIKTYAAALLFFMSGALFGQDNFTLKIKPPIPGSNPAEIDPGCNKCSWDIYSSGAQETQGRRIRAMYYDGKYRLEITGPDGPQTQVVIFDNSELYVLNPFFKTAALYYIAEAGAPMLLESIFPGIGLQKKDRTVAGREIFNNRECDVISYRILKRGPDMFVWGSGKEWLDKKTGRTLKVETLTNEAAAPYYGKKMTSPAVKQVYEAGKVRHDLFMDRALFKVPRGYRIVDMKKQYEEALEKQKGIKPGKGYKVRKITISPAKDKK